MTSSMLEAALKYADKGISVFPCWHVVGTRCGCGDSSCSSPGKHPLTRNGFKNATTDPAIIRGWWGKAPEPNIGGACGPDFTVIDEDEPGALLASGLDIPNTPTQRTGRGRHFVFRSNGYQIPNRVRFAPGLDVRSTGGYVLLAPSMHVSGTPYAWIAGHGLDDLEWPHMPDIVAKVIIAAKPNGADHPNDHDLFGRVKLEALLQELETMPPPGNGGLWRKRMLRIVGSLVGRRLPDDLIVSLCRRATWHDAGFSHEDTDAWVRNCIRDTRRAWDVPPPDEDDISFNQNDGEAAQAAATETQARLRLVPPSEMDWRGAQLNLVKGILGHSMMALLYGESGSAKTLMALSLALHVALGREWCGHKVTRGFVAYLAPEGGHSVHLRFHAWCKYHSISPSDDSMPFRTIPVRVNLCSSDADLEGIIANIKAAESDLGPCVLAVVDTVSRALAGGNENAPDDMGKFVGNCDRLREETGATVLGVHHTPKGGDDPRGHSSLKNGSEVRMMARKVANGLFSLTLDHLKDGDTGDELMFDLHSAVVGTDDEGEPVSGGLVVKAGITSAGASGNPRGKLTDRQLRILQEMSNEAFRTKRWEFTSDEFNDLCIRSGAVDMGAQVNIQRARCSDLKRQLANKGYVTVDGEKIRLVLSS